MQCRLGDEIAFPLGLWEVSPPCSGAHEWRPCRRWGAGANGSRMLIREMMDVVEVLTGRRLKGRTSAVGGSRRGSEDEVSKHFSHGRRLRENADSVMSQPTRVGHRVVRCAHLSRSGWYNLYAPPVCVGNTSPQRDWGASGRKIVPVPSDQHDTITINVMIVGTITSSNTIDNALVEPRVVKVHVQCWRVPRPVAVVCKSIRGRSAIRPRRRALFWICEWTSLRSGCIGAKGVKGIRFRVGALDVKGVWDGDTRHGNGSPTKQSPYRTDGSRNRGCHHALPDT